MKNRMTPRKIIVAVAPVGRSTQPPAINPRTPKQVADKVIRCARAGAGMVHLHVRDAKGVQTEDIRYWAKRMRQTKTVPEMEIFDSGMLPVARALVAEGAIKPPYSICFALGFHWTLAPDPKSLFFMTSMMNETVPWGVIHDGMTDFTLLATAIGLGASLVRVGFEDSIYWAPDQAVKRNVELVQKLAQLVRLLGHAVATPAEARAILGIRRI